MRIPAVVDRALQYLSQPHGGSTRGPISDGSDSRAQRQPKSNTVPQILISVLLHQGERFSNDLRLFSKLISWCFFDKTSEKSIDKTFGGRGRKEKHKSLHHVEELRKRTGKQKTIMERMTKRRGKRVTRNRGKETPAAVTQHLSRSQTRRATAKIHLAPS